MGRGAAERLGGPYVAEAASFCPASIGGYYQAIAWARDQGEPRHFTEKFDPRHVPRLAWDPYSQAREVLRVRDLRDVVGSMLVSNARRGFASFGREVTAADAEYVGGPWAETLRLWKTWLERRERSPLVRYEDVALYPAESLERILTYLDFDAERERIDQMLAGGGTGLAGTLRGG